jgi:hypothetical protein
MPKNTTSAQISIRTMLTGREAKNISIAWPRAPATIDDCW